MRDGGLRERGAGGRKQPSSDRAEFHQSSDGVLVQRVLAGRVVEARLHGVAGSQGGAAREHARGRGGILGGEELVVGSSLLVVVMVRLRVVAAEVVGGGGRRGLAQRRPPW